MIAALMTLTKPAGNKDTLSLPRLCYIGDVPVESSYHGSALLYRLLQKYPAQNLVAVEQSFQRSLPDRRLADVRYEELRTAMTRFLTTRFYRFAAIWLTLNAERQAQNVQALLGEFRPQAILTVAHGFSWLGASILAERNNLPLHLIVHDEWPQIAITGRIKSWMNKRFCNVYRKAASRLCVSPVMVEEYERRYGVRGTVLYPSRGYDTPCFDGIGEIRPAVDRPFTIAFAGSLHTGDYIRQLIALSRMVGKRAARMLLFGPFDNKALIANGLDANNVVIGGLLPSTELVQRLRAEADVLFVPESFEEAGSGGLDLSFPSKLTDYTATALPLLIWGPKESAAVRWAFSERGVAAVVTEPDENAMAAMLKKLATELAWRRDLGATAFEVGKRYFSPERAQSIFYEALLSSQAS
jgi:glycosyltransferase involved in cell wall biosynthesis